MRTAFPRSKSVIISGSKHFCSVQFNVQMYEKKIKIRNEK